MTNFFDEKEFSVEEYQYQNDKVCFAYYSKDNNDKIQKAIVFKIKEKSIEPLLFINENKVFNSTKLLSAPDVKNHEFYGWTPRITSTKNILKLTVDFYMDAGESVADPLFFELKNGVFERWFIPESEL